MSYVEGEERRKITSAPIWAKKFNFLFRKLLHPDEPTDHSTFQPTEPMNNGHEGHREVTINTYFTPII